MTGTDILLAAIALVGFGWAWGERHQRLQETTLLRGQRDAAMELAERQAAELAEAQRNDQRDSRGRFTAKAN